MLINKVYTFCSSLNKVQEIVISKTIGCSRFVYNHAITFQSILKNLKM
ncbi:helix-turn-helix domain-containing protein [Bacillus cereus]